MSRVGKKIIEVPEKVKVAVSGNIVTVTGPGGTLKMGFEDLVSIQVEGNTVKLVRKNEDKETLAKHGLYRALLQNMVTGVSTGFKRELDIVGVGYRAELKGKELGLALGFSHPVNFPIPEGITIKVDKQTHLTISGADRELVGEVAANIRKIRPPEPYKGKGVKYSDETILRKAGKAAGAGK